MSWEPATYIIAIRGAPSSVAGQAYRGLGMHIIQMGSPKGRPPRWMLTHIGSGHGVCWIVGRADRAFKIATEIAECGDWDFDGVRGYINRDPEILRRAVEIVSRYKECSRVVGYKNEAGARAIAIARACMTPRMHHGRPGVPIFLAAPIIGLSLLLWGAVGLVLLAVIGVI